jgi:diguanylate cyclase (GGDEF)-like protein
MSIATFLERWPKGLVVTVGAVLVLGLWCVDYFTPRDLSFVVFYLVPVFLVAWFADRRAGVFIALLSGLAWFTADVLVMRPGYHPVVPYWNVVVKVGFFLIVNQAIAELRSALEQAQRLARVDHLTGAFNSRHFIELAAAEVRRAGRYGHPFTMVYLDIDDFKSVNDSGGHSAGDALLVTVVSAVRSSVRATDVIARLGGDEFAVLLPETGYEASAVAVRKIAEHLRVSVGRMGRPVTFSIGAVTFVTPPESVDSMIRAADACMYAAKHGGKDRIVHRQANEKAA